MKIYLHNPDTLKPRIKKLKKALHEFEGLSPSLGLCRDLVARSLSWSDWNALYLGHQGNMSPNDTILFTGRWFDGELRKEIARKELSTLLEEQFGHVIRHQNSIELLSLLIWTTTISEYQNTFQESAVKKTDVMELPIHYWRDNILVDAETRDTYQDFLHAALLPHIATRGGVVFCSPQEARSIIQVFNKKGQQHGILIDNDYCDLIDDEMFTHRSMRLKPNWQQDENGLLNDHLLEIFHLYLEGKCPANARDAYLSWLADNIKAGETLCVEEHGAHLCGDIDSVVSPVVNNLFNGLIERLNNTFMDGVRVTFNDLLNTDIPLIIVAHSDSMAGHQLLSAFSGQFSRQHSRIMDRKTPAPFAPPKFLVLGYNDQIALPGFAVRSLYAGADNYSVVAPQNRMKCRHHNDTEMACFVANVGNIIHLKPKTLKRFVLRGSPADWFSIRNGRHALSSTLHCIPNYGEKNFNIEDHIHRIPLKW